MTEIDEAIKNYEKAAEEKEKQAIWLWSKEGNPNYDNCIEVAKKLRQLAKWLRKLKAYEEVDEETCEEKMVEIVIDIHEKDYQAIKNGHIPFSVLDAIKNGTPLPEHHGRLIDADALDLEREVNMADDWKTAHEIANCVKYAPTIVEGSDSE